MTKLELDLPTPRWALPLLPPARYKGAKGSVQFPLDRPMPLRLIERIVKFRVQEVRQKAIEKKAAVKKTAAKKAEA